MVDDPEETFNLIAKMHEAHEAKLKKYEPLVGTALSQDSFNKYKEKSLEICQKYSESLLCPTGDTFQLPSGNREPLSLQIQSCETIINDLQLELLFNKTLIDNLIKQKVDIELSKQSGLSLNTFNNHNGYFPSTSTNMPMPMPVGMYNNVQTTMQNVGIKRNHTVMNNTAGAYLQGSSPWLNQPSSLPQNGPYAGPPQVSIETSLRTSVAVLKARPQLPKQQILQELNNIYSLAQSGTPPLDLFHQLGVLEALVSLVQQHPFDEDVHQKALLSILSIASLKAGLTSRLDLLVNLQFLPCLLSLLTCVSSAVQLQCLRILSLMATSGAKYRDHAIRLNAIPLLQQIQDRNARNSSEAINVVNWAKSVMITLQVALSAKPTSQAVHPATVTANNSAQLAASKSNTGQQQTVVPKAPLPTKPAVTDMTGTSSHTATTSVATAVPGQQFKSTVLPPTVADQKPTGAQSSGFVAAKTPTKGVPGVVGNGPSSSSAAKPSINPAFGASAVAASQTPKTEKKAVPVQPKSTVKYTSKNNIHKLIKTPELLESTLQGHLDAAMSATASREDKFNGFQFIYDLFQADYPPMEVVDKLKLLPRLCAQAIATNDNEVLENALVSMLTILLMTEGSHQRVQQVIADGLLPRLLSLLNDFTLLTKASGIPFNAMRILNSIAQDSPDHLQAVLSLNPLPTLMKIVVHSDSDDYVHSQATNILCTLSAAVDIAPHSPPGHSVYDVLWRFIRYNPSSNGTIVAQGCEIFSNVLKSEKTLLSEKDWAFVCTPKGILSVLTASMNNTKLAQSIQLHATRAVTALLSKIPLEFARTVVADHDLVARVSSQLKSLTGSRSVSGVTLDACRCLSFIVVKVLAASPATAASADATDSGTSDSAEIIAKQLSSHTVELLKDYTYGAKVAELKQLASGILSAAGVVLSDDEDEESEDDA